MSFEMKELPPGWDSSTIGEWCENLDSKRIPINSDERKARLSGKSDDQLYPYFGATGQVGRIDGYLFDGEHVLIGEDGAPFLEPFRDKAYMVSGRFWVNNHAHILKPTAHSKFVCHYLNQFRYSDHVTGTTRLKLTKAALNDISIPIAPLNEQRRIVAKIEELFSALDKGIENLKQARAQLAVYRQALLKHAFEGKLTAAWRVTQGDSSGWSEVAVSDVLIGKPTNGRSVPDRAGGFRVLRLTSIKNGYIDLTQNKEGAWTEAEAADQILHPGDFLISRGNGSLHLVGKGGLVLSDDRIAYPDTMVRMKVNPSGYDQRLFCYFWNSSIFRRQIESSARTTAGIYKINQALIMAYRFPLMPLAEQRAIVEMLDSQMPTIHALETDIDANLQKADALRQAILKKAFAGELVPQDPADPPAATLLARIRAERAAAVTAQGVGKPSRRAARV